MGFYRRFVFPRLLEWTAQSEEFTTCRKKLLNQIDCQRVLEIGFGTGLNVPHYPQAVQQLVVVEPNAGMHAFAKQRITQSPIQFEFHSLNSENLPFADESFAAIVSTLTLCSIDNVEQALAECRRVLKTSGELFLLEHGQSPDTSVARWQHRLTPLQKKIGDGCRLDRDIRTLIETAGFEFLHCESFYLPKAPRLLGYMTLGVARKPSTD